ncbi:hypothetical protein J40TS1_23870 [Paenibacillus montaniterrae]|uniref:Cell envelope-related transcriptional attenuator domain-containing protein n=2 Tax=Paenibacillus montaniterrae TaxID=429341 RepID=A0A920CXW3_9BACL|nr:hypothetical protein J40TS1_23870 [Paenibacillus montaniterrae]
MASNKPQTNQNNQQVTASRVATKGSKKKKKRPVLKAFLFIIIFALLVVVGYGAYIVIKGNEALKDISIANNVDDGGGKVTIPVKDSVKAKPVTMVLLGIDQRKGGGGLNTDVIMVAALNPTTKKGAVIAMPRDTKINYQDRTRKVNAFYANFYTAAQKNGADKNEAMRQAKDGMKQLLGEFYGVPFQYAVSVNFQGFMDVVDVLGGIEVDVDMRMRWTDSHDGTNIDLHPGLQPLDGKQTLDFVRFRQSKDNPNASSDFERNTRQTVVINAILKKMMSLGGVTKIGNVIEEVSEDVHTDMPSEEITRLLTTYYNINMDNITFMTLQGKWSNPYVEADAQSLAEAQQLLQSIISE